MKTDHHNYGQILSGPNGVMLQKMGFSIMAVLKDERKLSQFMYLFRRSIMNNGPDNIEELLDRHLKKKDKKEEESIITNRQRLTSNRREALSLYRDIIRASRFFLWPDDRGILWRDILRDNARREFEEARHETDPETITRLLIGGRDALDSALEKLVQKQKQMMNNKRNKGPSW
ncbi:uncharacterized protein LOC116257391 isoform X1 [Nymphaea colorata]|nr:uncharacterized protein LOC116257391 isoform X1 [Nymphaea colorata]XP_049934668.1 uncharacterized protein LOC116257391 isoform X1 [Nymphaea colorata]